MKTSAVSFLIVALCVAACSSSPHAADAPAWISQASRTVDNGYIVYVGVGEDELLERARFKAEMVAVADLANECSLAPKGTRTEDRYDERFEGKPRSYAKVGLTFEECETAKNAVDPETIRRLANARLTEELKKYQEMTETTEAPQLAEVAPGTTPEANGAGATYTDSTQYYAARQQLVVWKQVVILAPPAAYPPQAPQTVAFIHQVSPVSTQVQSYERVNPAVRRPMAPNWSTVQRQTPALQPHSFAPHSMAAPAPSHGAATPSRFSSPSHSPSQSSGGLRPGGGRFRGGRRGRW